MSTPPKEVAQFGSRLAREVRPASKTRALTEYRAKHNPRFYLMAEGQYLHMFGQRMTDNKADAYVGFAAQVAAIQGKAGFASKCAAVLVGA